MVCFFLAQSFSLKGLSGILKKPFKIWDTSALSGLACMYKTTARPLRPVIGRMIYVCDVIVAGSARKTRTSGDLQVGKGYLSTFRTVPAEQFQFKFFFLHLTHLRYIQGYVLNV